MAKIPAVIDGRISIEANALPAEVVHSIIDALTIPNASKERAMREMVAGWKKLPDWIDLWHTDGTKVIIPRCFVFGLDRIVYEAGHELEWDDRMSFDRELRFVDVAPIGLRSYQERAVDRLIEMCSGNLVMPTGGGKTRSMLEIIRRLSQKSIVFVDKVNLLDQWIEAAADLGMEAGAIGSGVWEEKELTIALRQTVWSRRRELAPEWFESFGLLTCDEAHHGSSDTYWMLVQLFTALYRYGCTATPERDPESFPIMQAVLGPVVHETPPEEVGDALVKPVVQVVQTSFEFDYEPTKMVLNESTNRMRRKQNNYNAMMDALQADPARNNKIVDFALADAIAGHSVLILSKRKEHLNLLEQRIQEVQDEILTVTDHLPVFQLTGANSKKAREIAATIASLETGSILLSTVADEGTDIPRLDRLLLAYPARKILGTKQAAGRVTRSFPGKTDAIIYDFMDGNVSLLRGQFRERRQTLWNKEGFDVRIN